MPAARRPGYRKLATALAAGGGDTYIVQYPQRAERLSEPAARTVQDLARSLFVAGPWRQVAPLRLFGHSMGAVVAFEFARIAESRGAAGAAVVGLGGSARRVRSRQSPTCPPATTICSST